ncbi:Acetyltransferase (GNAT) family protein [Devosia equisanguinis]|uniref:Acetyltransferase (GNAT) family protein n=1 Tax=Devosia equisanguinis TaxID=2490941 RepID=A0A3S4DQN1_9HYPH|nr:Acetyltransferase (GNAT) family protein [Devosia equisanguinis]
MIVYRIDPHPSDQELDSLWRRAWTAPLGRSYQPVLARSLGHVGCYHGKQLVGFVNIAWDGGVHAFILDTCTDPDFQRRGIATELVRQAALLARERGAEWLHVDCEPHLDAFYRGCGFRPSAAGVMKLS